MEEYIKLIADSGAKVGLYKLNPVDTRSSK
jgi:hypothetical protein